MKARAVVIAVVGSKRSGKTTTVEALVRELSRKGYRVAAIKHISERDFTLDTKGKDTWRYAQAGARTIIGISANEMATIERTSKAFTLKDIIERSQSHDIVFLEGFKKLVNNARHIPKIVTVKSKEEALEAMSTYKPTIAFAGPFPTDKLGLRTPYADALRNPTKLAGIVEAFMIENGKRRSRQ